MAPWSPDSSELSELQKRDVPGQQRPRFGPVNTRQNRRSLEVACTRLASYPAHNKMEIRECLVS